MLNDKKGLLTSSKQ